MSWRLFACSALLLCPLAASAQTVGYVYDGYYTYQSDGYFYWNGQPFTRTWSPGYYYTQNYYQYYKPGYYTYARYIPVQTYSAPAVTYQTPGWKAKLLELAMERDRIEGKIVADAIEQKNYMEAVAALGLQRPGMNHSYLGNYYGATMAYSAPGGGMAYPGAYGSATYSSLNLGAFGANASTGYGHTYSAVANLYQQPNLELLFQQASRLTENAQKLSGQATSEFQASVGMQGGYQAKVAEILAKGQAAKDILQGLQGNGFQYEKKELKLGPAPAVDPTAPPSPAAAPGGGSGFDPKQIEAAWKESAKRCAGCHGSAKPEGGFKVYDVSAMVADPKTLDRRLRILARLVTSDPQKMMPRKGDGSPGEPLPEQEMNLWKMYLTQ